MTTSSPREISFAAKPIHQSSMASRSSSTGAVAPISSCPSAMGKVSSKTWRWRSCTWRNCPSKPLVESVIPRCTRDQTQWNRKLTLACAGESPAVRYSVYTRYSYKTARKLHYRPDSQLSSRRRETRLGCLAQRRAPSGSHEISSSHSRVGDSSVRHLRSRTGAHAPQDFDCGAAGKMPIPCAQEIVSRPANGKFDICASLR